jgi:hypothetical protein
VERTSWLSNIRTFVAAARLMLSYAEAAHSPMLMRTVSSNDVRKNEKYFVGGLAAETRTCKGFARNAYEPANKVK